MRPIDAYALRNKKKNAIINTHERYECEVVEYIEIINAPTIDYKDLVPQGIWKKETLVGCEPYYLCPICGKLHDQDYDFCNGCGARLRGK